MEIVQVDLNKDYAEVVQTAVSVLSSGGTIVYPTDTLYGLGANALDEKAVEKIFKIKNRSFSKPLPIIVKNMIWAKELAFINYRTEEMLNKVWPGAGVFNAVVANGAFAAGKITAVLPKKDIVPDILTAGLKNIGMRIPDYVFTDKLLGQFGYPVTSTSANISGEEPDNNIEKIISMFEKREFRPDLVIDAGILSKSEPSTILDLTASTPKILRVGPSKPEQLLKLLEI